MKHLILTILCIACALNTTAQTRGTLEGEIYYPTSTYIDNQGQVHTAIFRSTDHGAHLQLQYETLTEPPAGDMSIGQVVGDATPGVLYNYSTDTLYYSVDYGHNWQMIEYSLYENLGEYFAGNSPAIIYKTIVNSSNYRIELYESVDFGNTFNIVNDSVYGFWGDVGYSPGDIHLLKIKEWPEFELGIRNSNNYGISFEDVSIDSLIAGLVLSGNYPKISRGANPGELYLVTWHLPSYYHIYHSADYGQTFTLQYLSDECDFYYWGYSFTAGRQPGSFYVFRNYLEHNGTHRELYIDYSSDYGQTFTTFHHTLDSTVSIAEPAKEFQIRTYPNPFHEQLTIELPRNISLTDNYRLNIYNTQGKLITTKPVYDYNITWQPHNLPGGIYFIKLQTEKKTYTVQKVFFTNLN
jgi:hypothetical protein